MRGTPPTSFDRLIRDKSRVFWLLQIGGWSAYALLRLFQGLINGMGPAIIGPTLVAAATGFSLTLIMAAVYRRIIDREGAVVWAVTVLMVLTASAVFSALEIWGHATFYDPAWQPQGLQFLAVAFVDLLALTAWSALYFGINFYLMLRQQTERVLKITAQAHEAQLKMLRYQLNPHFLFNTLNSISTLVLMKDSARANAMLNRLSSFLRYTLHGEPSQTVTVAQEIDALKLYLDIERMRFEDRLRVEINISAEAMTGLIPSLLMQPLIENAIKYAVAPSEDGATISISARVGDGQLFLTVSDTGPGFTAPTKSTGSGVGLVNIKDRLTQIYGPEHSFAMRANTPQGAIIDIRIPYETHERAAQPTIEEAA
jgi:two-component system, LytTR family, sensor kinase